MDLFVKAPAAAVGLLAAVALAACGEATPGTAVGAARTTSQAAAPGTGGLRTRTQSTPSGGTISEVADPQEASSFPAPASVKHAAAKTPAKAGSAIAAGAPSDAEVRAELSQMKALEQSAKHAQLSRLTPVPGGRSISGSGALPISQALPEVIQKVIAGANEIADFPYVFGGGHGSFVDNAYDCSGSVSYALAAGGLLGVPETSGELESWGAPGPGRYITVFANAGHTYMYVNGVMYNTAGRSGVYASRWQIGSVENSGFVARHYPGL